MTDSTGERDTTDSAGARERKFMPIAVGLPGTARDLDVVFVRSVAKLPKVMRDGKYASAADDNGSISAWIEAVKKWYAEWLNNIA